MKHSLPAITVNKSEIRKMHRHKNDDIKPFPVYMGSRDGFCVYTSQDKKKVYDVEAAKEVEVSKLALFEDNDISYIIKDLHITDYIIRSQYTSQITAIKRTTMKNFIEFIDKYGTKQFLDVIHSLRKAFVNDVRVELIIEEYYASFFDYAENCVRVLHKFTELDKGSKGRDPLLDKHGNAIFAWSTVKRYNINPHYLKNIINDVESIGVHVVKTFGARDVFIHFTDLLFEGQSQEDVIHDSDLRVKSLQSMFSELSEKTAKECIEKYNSVIDFINAIYFADNASELDVKLLDTITFNRIKQKLTLNFNPS